MIDNYELLRRSLCTVPERASHEVREAQNGCPGLAACRAQPADPVITDLIPELARAFLDVRVIAMSGVRDREKALHIVKLLGAQQTLRKPFRAWTRC